MNLMILARMPKCLGLSIESRNINTSQSLQVRRVIFVSRASSIKSFMSFLVCMLSIESAYKINWLITKLRMLL